MRIKSKTMEQQNENLTLIEQRRYYNEQILQLLYKHLITKDNEQRFLQLLFVLNQGKDFFYEEPQDTFARFKVILDEEEP